MVAEHVTEETLPWLWLSLEDWNTLFTTPLVNAMFVAVTSDGQTVEAIAYCSKTVNQGTARINNALHAALKIWIDDEISVQKQE